LWSPLWNSTLRVSRAQYSNYKTFYGCNLQIFIIDYSVCT
jgi:hypothetical protein